jgi:transposase
MCLFHKLQILEEADRPTEPGEIGPLLRCEGLYSSLLAAWREQHSNGTLGNQARVRRGKHTRDRKVEELEKDNARLAKKLEKAETIMSVKKTLALVGDRAPTHGDTESS